MLTAATLIIVKTRMSQYVMDDLSTRLEDESNLYQRVEQVRRLQSEQTAQLIANQPSLKALMSTNDRLTVQDASEAILNSSGADCWCWKTQPVRCLPSTPVQRTSPLLR